MRACSEDFGRINNKGTVNSSQLKRFIVERNLILIIINLLPMLEAKIDKKTSINSRIE